jgi:hypothetical protein
VWEKRNEMKGFRFSILAWFACEYKGNWNEWGGRKGVGVRGKVSGGLI